MIGDRDTIAAIATAPRVTAALSIVRVSGQKCTELLQKCFLKPVAETEKNRFYFGNWINPNTKEILDEVVLLNYPDGTGFTGERAIEIISHGGPVVTELILETILSCGARLAKAGEFSYRAVLNNKMSLTQAEAVFELIHAKSPLKAKQALNNLKGILSQTIGEIESTLVYVLAHLEASIDFTTEDIQPVSFTQIESKIEELEKKIKELIAGYEKNNILQEGVRIAITGKPNAGKSSLLNTLVGKERSIVTPIEGTTRDTIEQAIFIDGLPITLIDTAGIRNTENIIEQFGVQKAKQEIEASDIVLYVIDSTLGVSVEDKEELLKIKNKEIVICFNKSDISNTPLSSDILNLSHYQCVKTSCQSAAGVLELKNKLKQILSKYFDTETPNIVSNKRHFEELKKVNKALFDSRDLIKKEESPDLVAFEVKNALIGIKEILYKEMNDEVLDTVFKEFCIGK